MVRFFGLINITETEPKYKLSPTSYISYTSLIKSVIIIIKNEFYVDLKDQNLELIVDGGSENNNKTISEFIKDCHVNINKKIALKDVTFSNCKIKFLYTFHYPDSKNYNYTPPYKSFH